MGKRKSMILGLVWLAAALGIGGCVESEGAGKQESAADMLPVSEQFVLFSGTVAGVEDGLLTMNRREGDFEEEVLVTVSEDTLVLEAVDGLPLELSGLTAGEAVQVYVEPVMTMSLPPVVNGLVILGKVPADAGFPSYTKVKSCEALEGGEYRLTAYDGGEGTVTYRITEETRILPYLTRNIVTAEDLKQGTEILVWGAEDEAETAEKIVVFAGEEGNGK